jgi:hypothetical protein
MMGFWDERGDELKSNDKLDYISQEEKAVIVKNKTPLEVQRVFYSETGGWEGKPKYTLVVKVAGDEDERGISFGGGQVESRDRVLDSMKDYLDTEDDVEHPIVLITKTNKGAFLLVPPDEA